MLRLTLCLVGATLGLCGLFAATAQPARAQLQLQAKGRSEGAFVFYVGGPTAPWEAKAKIFEQRYPGIKVSITGGFSNVLDKKIDLMGDLHRRTCRCARMSGGAQADWLRASSLRLG